MIGIFEGEIDTNEALAWLYEEERREQPPDPPTILIKMEKLFGRCGSKVSQEEVEAFLGRPPKIKDLPDWLRESIPIEDGGLPSDIALPDRVAAPYLFSRKYPPSYGLIYGILRLHAVTQDDQGRRQTYVSVARIASESGCSIQWVHRVLRVMERDNIILVKRRKYMTNLYTLLQEIRDIHVSYTLDRDHGRLSASRQISISV